MNLLLDIGNTRVKWALSHHGRICEQGEALHRPHNPASALSRISARPIDAIWASNVAGERMAEALKAWAAAAHGLEPRFVTAVDQSHGVINAYAEPEQLGSDRWLAMIAAYQAFQQPLCVIDCGSAVTIDGVLADGRHLGGAIMPGLSAMRQSLAASTRLTVGTERLSGGPPWQSNTAACIEAGLRHGIVGLLIRFQAAMKTKTQGTSPLCVITGGDAPLLLPLLTEINHCHRPGLVLQGLALMSQTQ